MIPDVRDNAVTLLRSAPFALCPGAAQNLGPECGDSVENRHPAFLDGLNAQPESRAEFGVGFPGESRSKELLFRGSQMQHRRLVTIHSGGNGVWGGENTLPGHNSQRALV